MPAAMSPYDYLMSLMTDWSLEADANAGGRYQTALARMQGHLAGGATQPGIALRAVQLLLLDPEQADRRQRSAVKEAARVLQEGWPGIERQILSMQALVMAAWPAEPSGWLRRLPGLLGSPLEEGVLPGRAVQRSQILAFWETARGGVEMPSAPPLVPTPLAVQLPLLAPDGLTAPAGLMHHLRSNRRTAWTSDQFMGQVYEIIASIQKRATYLSASCANFSFEPRNADFVTSLNHLSSANGPSWSLNNFGAQLHSVLAALVRPMKALLAQLGALGLQHSDSSVDKHLAELQRRQGEAITFEQFSAPLIAVLEWLDAAYSQLPILDALNQVLAPQQAALDAALRQARGEMQGRQELLWWGQARYCHHLQTPYRRLQGRDPEAVLLYAAFEAAARAGGLPIEPVAAYLCEVLHALGQDLSQRRSLREWMAAQHAALRAAPLPALTPSLSALAGEDPLGLPVTFLRLPTSQAHAWDGDLAQRATAAVALPLDNLILDRAQWASWLLREALLDQALGGAEAR